MARRKKKPSHGGPTGLETSEFRYQFAEETSKLLRRRLIWFIALWGGLGVTIAVYQATAWLTGNESNWPFSPDLSTWSDFHKSAWLGGNAIWAAGYVAALIFVLGGRVSKLGTARLSIALVILNGISGIIIPVLIGLPGASAVAGLFGLMFFHVIAAMVFPWTPRQAVAPMIVILVLNAGTTLYHASGGLLDELLFIGFSPIFAVPGTLSAWMRHSRRLERATLKFVQGRYGMMRQELAYARQIHEALFPRPTTKGDICFTYRYEPMRQIGGDFLYACTDKRGRMSVVLLDVTGHGVPAALTVNRLHGEVELMFAEDAEISPGEVLARLNRYVHLTLARHSIYVTALCLRADAEEGTLEFANGGHPPAFLRTADGRIEDLNSTSFVLGACPDEAYDHGQVSVPFARGDSVIAYTDGATEARAPSGKMVRVDGLRAFIADAGNDHRGEWPARVLDIVTQHRGDLAPEDDTLVVELYRPVTSTSKAKAREVAEGTTKPHADGTGPGHTDGITSPTKDDSADRVADVVSP